MSPVLLSWVIMNINLTSNWFSVPKSLNYPTHRKQQTASRCCKSPHCHWILHNNKTIQWLHHAESLRQPQRHDVISWFKRTTYNKRMMQFCLVWHDYHKKRKSFLWETNNQCTIKKQCQVSFHWLEIFVPAEKQVGNMPKKDHRIHFKTHCTTYCDEILNENKH